MKTSHKSLYPPPLSSVLTNQPFVNMLQTNGQIKHHENFLDYDQLNQQSYRSKYDSERQKTE